MSTTDDIDYSVYDDDQKALLVTQYRAWIASLYAYEAYCRNALAYYVKTKNAANQAYVQDQIDTLDEKEAWIKAQIVELGGDVSDLNG